MSHPIGALSDSVTTRNKVVTAIEAVRLIRVGKGRGVDRFGHESPLKPRQNAART